MNLRCGSTWDMEMDVPSACVQTKKGLKAEARVETEISQAPIRGDHLNSCHSEKRKGQRRRTNEAVQILGEHDVPFGQVTEAVTECGTQMHLSIPPLPPVEQPRSTRSEVSLGYNFRTEEIQLPKATQMTELPPLSFQLELF